MTSLRAMICAASLSAGACKFEPPPPLEAPDATAVDAGIDAEPVECEPDTIVCDDANGRYVECGSDGAATRIVDCPVGCATDMERCLDVEPSNGLAGYLDQAAADESVVDVTFAGNVVVNTDAGTVEQGGVPVEVPSAVANGIRVFMFKELDIPGTVKVRGDLAVAFVAAGPVSIAGIVDVSADGLTDGPGAVATGTCLGVSSIGITGATGGAGGGGRFQTGARGGFGYDTSSAAAGGDAMSDVDLQPLVGGCRGGEARFLVQPPPPPNGGGGGGAIQITSRREIRLTGTGTIDASGGGGPSNASLGQGGGSGGAVLLEAPSIVLDGPGVVISTKGGAGAGMRSSSTAAPGADGGTGPQPAAGGALSGYAAGGAGGTEASLPGIGGNGNSTNLHGGGGGGSVGEARFNAIGAAIAPVNGAAIRSRYSTAEIGSRVMQ